MENVKFIEFDKEKAKNWYIREYKLSDEEIEELECYDYLFKNIQEVFEWIYFDENDGHNDWMETLRMISTIDVNKVVESGASTISEYLVWNWERCVATPYGYIIINV